MAITAKTNHPEDAKKLFNAYADVLDMYASDQYAMISRYRTQKEKRAAIIRAEVYSGCATEIREIEFTKE